MEDVVARRDRVEEYNIYKVSIVWTRAVGHSQHMKNRFAPING
jgi:hypothetical protein